MMAPAIIKCFTEQESMLFVPRYQKNAIWALGALNWVHLPWNVVENGVVSED